MKKIINDPIRFNWDHGNQNKNLEKHDVSWRECEQVFFNEPLLIYDDIKHSQTETRHYALGHTDDERQLFIAFTIRESLIRVISARDMNLKERRIYEETEENIEKNTYL